MQSQYSIRILDQPGGGVVFWPWVPGKKAGDPLTANAADLVTWNNMSSGSVTLVAVDPKGTYITAPIASGKVSAPIFQVPATGQVYQTSDGKTQHSIVVPSSAPTA